MFVIDINLNPNSHVEASLHKESHGNWVIANMEKGIFLYAGQKPDKTGGVVITKDISEKELYDIMNTDSYVINNVINFNILEFNSLNN
ncbi:hypothetical protein RJ729_14280 [Acinetobacter pittii]|uniref:YciI family protein n=1 Tax=Acinetobacter pittii TaxID=48296 RepID=UPI003892C608